MFSLLALKFEWGLAAVATFVVFKGLERAFSEGALATRNSKQALGMWGCNSPRPLCLSLKLLLLLFLCVRVLFLHIKT